MQDCVRAFNFMVAFHVSKARLIAEAAERFGIQALATGARISRQALYDVLDGKSKPRPRTLRKLVSVVRQMIDESSTDEKEAA